MAYNKKEVLQANTEAIRVVLRLEKERREATEAEKVLARRALRLWIPLIATFGALMVSPFPGIWRMAAPVVSVMVLCLLAFALQVLRCLLFYLWQGVPAPPGWLWGGLLSLLLLPILRWFADRSAQCILGVAR